MCMMKDVDPRAEILSRVFRLSSNPATKANVARGHHPGNGVRYVHAQMAANTAVAVVPNTKR
jgi:hypothetical protein